MGRHRVVVDEELIKTMYAAGASLRTIAAAVGVSYKTVENRLEDLNVARRGTQEQAQREHSRVDVRCPVCEEMFGVRISRLKRHKVLFCSVVCRGIAQRIAGKVHRPVAEVFAQPRPIGPVPPTSRLHPPGRLPR